MSARTQDEWDEVRFYAANSHRRFPELKRNTSAIVPHLLRCGVFNVAPESGLRLVDQVFPIHRHDSVDAFAGEQKVHYVGPRLWQGHKRVLLALTTMAAGRVGYIELEFRADELMGLMGREASTRNVESLIRLLRDLRAGTFTVRHHATDAGAIFGCLTAATWERRNFSVTMDPRCASALDELSKTFIPLARRNLLSDGMQTAIADLICATNTDFFQVEPLARMWGCDPVQFGRQVTPALHRLSEAGILESYVRQRGHFKIRRAHWFT